MSSSIMTLAIVRYAEFNAAEGVLTRQGVRRLQTLAHGLERDLTFPIQFFYLDWEGKPSKSAVLRTARVFAACLRHDHDEIQSIRVTGETEDERATNVRTLLEFLHDGKPTVVVVVDSELSRSLAALYTSGWPQNCVSTLDLGCAHVLQLERKVYVDL